MLVLLVAAATVTKEHINFIGMKPFEISKGNCEKQS
jgi:hypothetical protein